MNRLTQRTVMALMVLFFAIMLVSASVAAFRTLSSFSGQGIGSDPGWWIRSGIREARIVSVRSNGPAADALVEGDRIVSLNGEEVFSARQLARAFEFVPPQSTYTIVVERGGRTLSFNLKTVALPRGARTLLPLATVVIPAIFLFSGLALFVLKPNDKQSRLLALIFGTCTGLLVGSSSPDLNEPMRIVVFCAAILSTFFWPLFLHFFLIFPTRHEVLSPVLRRFPSLEYTLYAPHLLLTLPYSLIVGIYRAQNPEALAGFVQNFRWVVYLATGLPVAYLFAGLLSLLVNYDRAGVLLRRKMRVVVAGSVGGLVPMLTLFAIGLFFSERINEGVLMWFAVVAISAFALFPVSFLYAIARHQVIPVRLILRRGARYVFVSRGSIVVELIAVAVVLTVLLEVLVANFNLGSLGIGLLSGAVAILVWQVTRYLHHQVIGPLIDRSFFRQSYNAQQVLSELGQMLRGMASIDASTCTLICERTRAAIQAENVTIFLLDEAGSHYRCVVKLRHDEEAREQWTTRPELSFPADGILVRRLGESVKPLRVDFEDPWTWARTISSSGSGSGPVEHDAAVLQRLRSALLLPIASKEQLIGIMSLGPRLGDLPYSREDEHLLSAVTWQLAYAIENARLVQQRAEEDRLQREMKFAAEVQMRLFPQVAPTLPSLELSGVCHPARGVGGDYYDFLQLENGQIGIAVADVSGKGMSAALLMSTVQASLRTQAPLSRGRITELVTSMNRLLCESTDMSHYATFFYGEYDERRSLLTYVNAGHNPPMLFRNGSGSTCQSGERDLERAIDSVKLLECGGPVIGLLRDSCYEDEVVEMVSGDVLVAFTDGVSEARNPEDEEFGEERLAVVISENLHLEADQIREAIVSEVRTWCRGISLHDDLTLVVVKVKEGIQVMRQTQIT